MGRDAYQVIPREQVSWKRVLDTIDARIGSHLDNGDESLQHWRTVFMKTRADFQEKYLGDYYDFFVSFVVSVDGRSEDSRFPNMLLPNEREPFGL